MLPQVVWRGALILFLLLANVPLVAAQEQDDDPVQEMINQLSTRMKVGQLVMVSFPGTDVGDDSEIARLLRDYGIGGILLRPENGNFGAGFVEASAVLSMTNELQFRSWQGSRYIPLFMGVEGAGGSGLR
ncbi:MAG: hypothetical protein ACP5GX_08545, partial [Anaerolineae bacterium]